MLVDNAVTPDRPRGRRLAHRDQAWLDSHMVWAVADVDLRSIEQIRESLLALAAARPELRFFQRFDRERRRLIRPATADLDRFVDWLVVEDPTERDRASVLAEVGRERRRPLDSRPFRLTVGPTWFTLSYCHALGDVVTMWPLFVECLRPGPQSGVDQSGVGQSVVGPARPEPSWPLLDAGRHAFGRDPRRLVRLVRATRPAPPAPVGDARRAAGGGLEIAFAVSDDGFRDAVKEARKRADGPTSAPGILLARAHQAARTAGIETFDGAAVLADARRFLPGRTFASGNFAVAAYLAFPDATDAVAVSAAIDEYGLSGRALLTMAASTASTIVTPILSRLRRSAPDHDRESTVPRFGRSFVTFSFVGARKVPRVVPAAMVLGEAVGRDGISIIAVELNRRLHVSLTFDPAGVDRAAAQAVCDALTHL